MQKLAIGTTDDVADQAASKIIPPRTELRNGVKVEVVILGSRPSLISLGPSVWAESNSETKPPPENNQISVVSVHKSGR